MASTLQPRILARWLAIPAVLLFVDCRPASPPPTPVPSEDPAPEVPPFSVWRPFFFTPYGDHNTSHPPASAFAIRAGEERQAYLVTVLHVLSPESGLSQVPPFDELSESVRQLVVSEAFGKSDSTYPLDPPLNLDSRVADAEDWIATDAIFIPLGNRLKKSVPFEPCESLPSVGDLIWLSTAVYAGAPPSQTTHQAEVTEITATGRIRYRFDNPRLSFQAADGAPLIDASGRVVGMHVRAMPGDEGSPAVGEAVPIGEIQAALNKLLP